VVEAQQAQPSERGEERMMRRMHCGGGGRGVAPFYRVGVEVEGSGGDRAARWVLTPPVLKVLKGGEGIRRGVGLASRGASEGCGAHRQWPVERVAAVLATEGGRRPPVWAKLG
jgi:hypothetical protein